MRDLIIVIAVILQVDAAPEGAPEVKKLEYVRLPSLTIEQCVQAAKALNGAGPAFNAWCETPEEGR